MKELTEPWYPLGVALHDYLNGNNKAKVKVLRKDGDTETMEAALFFRNENNITDLEEYALSLCYGKILDIGAGAGCHSLILQNRGFDVTALDVSPLAAKAMKINGVNNIICNDFFEWNYSGTFDTIILLMNGIGFVETTDKLIIFLNKVKKLLAGGGQLLFDSSDLRNNKKFLKNRKLDWQNINYPGEVTFTLEYKNYKGKEYGWLYIDYDLLKTIAYNNGWLAQMLYDDGDGQYLVRMVKFQEFM